MQALCEICNTQVYANDVQVTGYAFVYARQNLSEFYPGGRNFCDFLRLYLAKKEIRFDKCDLTNHGDFHIHGAIAIRINTDDGIGTHEMVIHLTIAIVTENI